MDRRNLESGFGMLEGQRGLQELLRRARLGAIIEESEIAVFRSRFYKRAVPSGTPRPAAQVDQAAPGFCKQHVGLVP